jgi:hypothetical protein
VILTVSSKIHFLFIPQQYQFFRVSNVPFFMARVLKFIQSQQITFSGIIFPVSGKEIQFDNFVT